LRGTHPVRVVAHHSKVDHTVRLLTASSRGPASRVAQNGVVLEISQARFEELVGDALDSIPPPLLTLLDNVVIQVADRDPDEPSLLGVYHGIALTERLSDYTFALPDTITLFRLPIVDACADEQEVAREVAITVVHEIGHHFGIDEDRLHELGWG
jgi:predicted Zn-dependent protease with MMP-like domain